MNNLRLLTQFRRSLSTQSFSKLREEFIAEQGSSVAFYKHLKTGAEVISVSNNSEEKCFAVGIRTLPKDSKGIAHIMEHSVFCGSKEYPIKDPLNELEKSTIPTYLNAITFSDWTCFPCAAFLTKDYYKMVHVILDAIYNPICLDALTLMQEGWRGEFNSFQELISITGIVRNEMKGNYSDAREILQRAVRKALFPESVYRFDNGGDPDHIPELTLQEFKDYYCKFYHPSNSKFWFFGSDDPEERLRLLNEFLEGYDKKSALFNSNIKPQKKFAKPIKVIEYYPIGLGGDIQKKILMAFEWVLADVPLDIKQDILLMMIAGLIFNSLAEKLNESICIDQVELANDCQQPKFCINLSRVSEQEVERVEVLVRDCLIEVARGDYSVDSVNEILDYLNPALGDYPYGLRIMFKSMRKWMYDMDPFDPLKFNEKLNLVKKELADEGPYTVVHESIQEFLLNNTHSVTMILKPSPVDFSSDDIELFKSRWTKEALEEHVDLVAELNKKHDRLDDINELMKFQCPIFDFPTLNQLPQNIIEICGVEVVEHFLDSSDFIHLDMAFNIACLDTELVPLLMYTCETSSSTFVEHPSSAAVHFPGCRSLPIKLFSSSSYMENLLKFYVVIQIGATSTASPFNMLFDMIHSMKAKFSKDSFKDWVEQAIHETEEYIQANSSPVVRNRMEGKINSAGFIVDKMKGISYLEALKAFSSKTESWEEIYCSLEKIVDSVFVKENCVLHMAGSYKIMPKWENIARRFINEFPTSSSQCLGPQLYTFSSHSARTNVLLPQTNEAIIIPTKVNFVGLATKVYETGYNVDGSALVIIELIRRILWDHVRERGGAYDASCELNNYSGVLSFVSFRDSKICKTLNVYKRIPNILYKFEDVDCLRKTVFMKTRSLENNIYPSYDATHENFLRYLAQVTHKDRIKLRQEMMSTSLDKVKAFADAIETRQENSVAVVIGCAHDIAAANEEKPNFFKIKRII